MTTTHLAAYLSSLAGALAESGGRAPAAELQLAADALTRLGDQSLREFAAQLDASRESPQPEPTPRRTASRVPRTPVAGVNVEQVKADAVEAKRIASIDNTTIERLNELLSPLDGLQKAQLLEVGKAVNLKFTTRASAASVKEDIRKHVIRIFDDSQRGRSS